MSDATERGAGLASVYRSIKKKENGVVRIDRAAAVADAERMSKAKGDAHNKPMAKVLGPSKGLGKSSY